MFNTSEEIIADIKAGKIIVLVDDEDRENEGDLICAAEFATPENINFMAIYAKGLICMPMDRTLTEKLVLTPMVDATPIIMGQPSPSPSTMSRRQPASQPSNAL